MKPAEVLICRATPIAPDPRVEKEARALAAAGYQVTLLGWDMSGEYPSREEKDGIVTYRCQVKAKFGRGLANLAHQLRWQVVLLAWLLRRRRQFAVIHACDFDTVLPALVMRGLFGKKVVYDIFDFYADMLRATPRRVIALIRALDLRLIGWADAVILADDARVQQIAGSHPRRLEIIYNSPEDSPAAAAESQEPPPVNPPGLRIAYVGNIQQEKGLWELLQALRHHPDWEFVLAGFGVDQDRLLQTAGSLPNVTWRGRVPYQQALEINRQADVLIATYDPAIPNNRFASSNKVFEAMMLGKPLIVARQTNMDQVVERLQMGLVVEYGQVPDLEQALARLAADPVLRVQMGKNARRAYESTYGWPRMQARLADLYKQVL